MGSARIAFSQASTLVDLAEGELEMPLGDGGKSVYRTTVGDHVEALNDLHTLHTLVLVGSFSLAESHCRLIQMIAREENWTLLTGAVSGADLSRAESELLEGGIDAWGAKLLGDVGQTWPTGYGNMAGLVEASIVRNLAAHGRTSIDEVDVENARRRRIELPFAVGQRIRIDYSLLNAYRGHLKQFCRTLSDGIVHMARGSHRKQVVGANRKAALKKLLKARSRS